MRLLKDVNTRELTQYSPFDWLFLRTAKVTIAFILKPPR